MPGRGQRCASSERLPGCRVSGILSGGVKPTEGMPPHWRLLARKPGYDASGVGGIQWGRASGVVSYSIEGVIPKSLYAIPPCQISIFHVLNRFPIFPLLQRQVTLVALMP